MRLKRQWTSQSLLLTAAIAACLASTARADVPPILSPVATKEALEAIRLQKESRIEPLEVAVAPRGGCAPSCVGADFVENEPGCVQAEDNYNGGCNFNGSSIAMEAGDLICATSASDGNSRDLDWYSFTVADRGTFRFTVNASFPTISYIKRTNCSDQFGAANFTGACVPNSQTVTLNPGTYYLMVGPSDFDFFPCTTYTASMEEVLTPSECAVDVLIVGNGGCADSVRDFIDINGHFNSVELFDTTSATPTLAGTAGYEVVLLYTELSQFNSNALGNFAADFHDAGGGVVIVPYGDQTSSGAGAVRGRWRTQQYSPMVPANSIEFGDIYLGDVLVPDHPIMQNVQSFYGYNRLALVPRSGSQVIAEYHDGFPLAVTRMVGTHETVALTFLPTNSICLSGNGITQFDDAPTLLTNAVTYAAGCRPVPCEEDSTPPTILNCPNDFTAQSSGEGYLLDYAPAVNETCPYTVERSWDPLVPLSLGENPVTLTVTDSVGLTDTCSFTVTVVDACGDVMDVEPSITVTGNTCGEGQDGSSPNCSGFGLSESDDVFYNFTPKESGLYEFNTCGSNFDTFLSVHTACPAIIENAIGCNDDACGLQSVVFAQLNANQTYTARVGGFGNDCGAYSFVVHLAGPPDPCATDTTAPVIEDCPSDFTTSCNTEGGYNFEYVPTVTEACDYSVGYSWTNPLPFGENLLTVTVTDQAGNSDSCSFTVNVAPDVKEPFRTFSLPLQDGWMRQPGDPIRHPNQLNVKAATIEVGDDGMNLGKRGIISFDTSGIPEDATISRARIRLTRATTAGSVMAFGNLHLDMGSSGRGARPRGGFVCAGLIGAEAVELLDYANEDVHLDVANPVTLPAGDGHTIFVEINKDNLGNIDSNCTTQFRLRFATESDMDATPDTISFSSGEAGEPLRPELIVEFTTDGCASCEDLSEGCDPVTAELWSTPLEDGLLQESHWTSEVGGAPNSAATSAPVGDTAQRNQLQLLINFDTTTIPEGAQVTSAELRVFRSSATGSWADFGPLQVGMRPVCGMSPWFGPSTLLEASDFQSIAPLAPVGELIIPATNTYTSTMLDARGLAAINKGGMTQMKLYFAIPDDGDVQTDQVQLGTGNFGSTSPGRPRLVVTYLDECK